MNRYSDEVREHVVTLALTLGYKRAALVAGIPEKTVYWWTHPDYAKRNRESSRLAKHRRRKPCSRGCGATCGYDNEHAICKRCARSERAVWTRQRIIQAVKEYAAKYGHPPGARDWSPSQARAHDRLDLSERFYEDGCWPHANSVKRVFGSWNTAITAAGFTPLEPGHKYVDLERVS